MGCCRGRAAAKRLQAAAPSGGKRAAGERAALRLDDVDAARAQAREVLLNGRVLPHVHVHRRRDQHGRAGREHDGREQVVGDTGRELRDEVRGSGRDQQRIGGVGQANVADLGFFGEIEGAARNRMARERLQGERGDELFGRAREHDPYRRTRLAEETHHLATLVRRDPAADADDDRLVAHAHALSSLARMSRKLMFSRSRNTTPKTTCDSHCTAQTTNEYGIASARSMPKSASATIQPA